MLSGPSLEDTNHGDVDRHAAALAEVLRLHSADARYAAIAGLSICQECGKQWPCPTVQVASGPLGAPGGTATADK